MIFMSFGQYLKNGNSSNFRVNVGGYDPGNPMNQWAFRSCAFSRFRSGSDVFLLDAMAGPGKFGKTILELHKEKNISSVIRISFNDVHLKPLNTLKEDGFEVIHSDIRCIKQKNIFDIVIERFGLKDLPQGQLHVALQAIRDALKHNGRIVIADMFAISKSSQKEAIAVHAAEQRFAGRNEEKEGICYIPTIEEWVSVLNESGFKASVRHIRARGNIELSVYKGRFSKNADDEDMVDYINAVLLESCANNQYFARDYGVSFFHSSEKTKISWPYAVIVGEKI